MAVLRIGIVVGRGRGLDVVQRVIRHVGQQFLAVVQGADEARAAAGADVYAAGIVVSGAESVQEAVIRAHVHHVDARHLLGLVGCVGLPRILRHRAAIQLVGPGARIQHDGRTHPGGARVDDVAEHAGAVAVARRGQRAGARSGLLVGAIAAQVVQAIGGRAAVAGVERRFLAGGQIGPFEGNGRRTAPGQHGAAAGCLGRHRSGRVGIQAGGARRHARQDAGGIPVGVGGEVGVAVGVDQQFIRSHRSGPGGGIVIGEVDLGTLHHRRRLLLVGGGGALR